MTVFDYSEWQPEGHYEKYADEDELFAEWIIFGKDPLTGLVTLIQTSSDLKDVITGLPREKAEELILLRRQYVSDLKRILNIRSHKIST